MSKIEELKNKIAKLKKKKHDLEALAKMQDVFQHSYKIYLNSVYGFTGTQYSPVFSVDLPTNVTDGTVGIQLRAFRAIDDAFLFTLAQHVVKYFAERKIEIYSFQHSIDYAICKKFEQMIKTIHPKAYTQVIDSISQNDMIISISKLDYMIAMRFHAVLVAIKTGVKTLAINYDAKVEKIAYDAFLPLLTISIDEDFDKPFERLFALKSEDLIEYSRNQVFEWKYFDKFLR